MSNEDFYKHLAELLKKIQNSKSFNDALPSLEPDILSLFNCQRVTVYQRNKTRYELVSCYKSGEELTEIRVPIGPQSISGYVASSKRAMVVKNPHNEEELKSIHAKLRFADHFDKKSNFRTRNMLVVPIIANEIVLGVLQLINKNNDLAFSKDDFLQAKELAAFLGQKFRHELGGTSGPFEYLVHQHLITDQQLGLIEDSAKSHSEVVRRLMEDAKVQAHDIGRSLEVFYQVPYLPFDQDKYHEHPSNKKLNAQYLKNNYAVLLADTSENPLLVMSRPNNTDLLDEVENATDLHDFKVFVALPSDVLKFLGASSDQPVGDLGEILDEIEDDEDEILDDDSPNEDAPTVVRLVNRILHDAKRLDASDIHIDPGKGKAPTKVRMRVDGDCQEVIEIPASHQAATIARIKIMSRLDIAERRLPQDGKFSVKIAGNLVEVRVATIPTVFGEGVVMRILASGGAMPFSSLNLSPRNNDAILELIKSPHGIILVVGPTGSGKTTTLHAVLGQLNTPDKKIWTAEDPVEITQSGLQQVQMNNKIGLDFQAALRAFLRADPDIILIGEMRDRETAHAGVEASLTGHLVLSTLHTNSAPETITRLLDLGIDPINFSDACIGILAQRLIRTLCGECKEKYKASQDEVDFLKRQYGENVFSELNINEYEIELYSAKGCQRCHDTGYRGRTGVHELLTMTPDLRLKVYQKSSAADMKEQAVKDGMRTLVQDAVYKVLMGQTDFAQLQRLSS